MLSKIVEIRNSTSPHTRPVTCLAKVARKYSYKMMLHYEGSDINTTSTMNIMRTEIKGGKTVETRYEGDGESETIQTLTILSRNRFDEVE